MKLVNTVGVVMQSLCTLMVIVIALAVTTGLLVTPLLLHTQYITPP
jgi:hypothetical protein